MKIAFTSEIPWTLFNDRTDLLHRVLKPMAEALQSQANDKHLGGSVRISILVDAKVLPKKRIAHAVEAIIDADQSNVVAVH